MTCGHFGKSQSARWLRRLPPRSGSSIAEAPGGFGGGDCRDGQLSFLSGPPLRRLAVLGECGASGSRQSRAFAVKAPAPSGKPKTQSTRNAKSVAVSVSWRSLRLYLSVRRSWWGRGRGALSRRFASERRLVTGALAKAARCDASWQWCFRICAPWRSLLLFEITDDLRKKRIQEAKLGIESCADFLCVQFGLPSSTLLLDI